MKKRILLLWIHLQRTFDLSWYKRKSEIIKEETRRKD